MVRDLKDWAGWLFLVLLWMGILVALGMLSGCASTDVMDHMAAEYHDLDEPKSCLTHFLQLYNPVVIEQGTDYLVMPGLGKAKGGGDESVEFSGTDLEPMELTFFTAICYLTDSEVRDRLNECMQARSPLCAVGKDELRGEQDAETEHK